MISIIARHWNYEKELLCFAGVNLNDKKMFQLLGMMNISFKDNYGPYTLDFSDQHRGVGYFTVQTPYEQASTLAERCDYPPYKVFFKGQSAVMKEAIPSIQDRHTLVTSVREAMVAEVLGEAVQLEEVNMNAFLLTLSEEVEG